MLIPSSLTVGNVFFLFFGKFWALPGILQVHHFDMGIFTAFKGKKRQSICFK